MDKPTSPINQESYNPVEGYAPEKLSVGTKVVFTNSYGISFPGRTIVRVEQDDKGDAYYIEPKDSYWFPARRANLTIEYIPTPK